MSYIFFCFLVVYVSISYCRKIAVLQPSSKYSDLKQ